MAGVKETYAIDLNLDHMDFIRSTQDKYRISDESKVVRIALDYLFLNPNLHEAVFGETRCRRCK
jgi:hypothetical protein